MKTRCTVIILLLVFPAMISESIAQEVTKSKPVFGIRYTANYASIPTGVSYSKNFKVLSSIPSVFVEFNKQFDFHIGMVYAHLLNPHWFEYSSFEQNAFGLSLGCRLTSRNNIRNLRLIGQVDLSASKVGFKQTNSHFQDFMVKKILWVPGLSMGGDYQLNNKFHMSAGCSAGLAIGEYYHLNKIIPSLFLGVDYRFGCLKKK
jgi:hypothetical protein